MRQHSIGQRASALILFILTQDDNDIIFIDQPEDDLDNKVIYDEVITAITQKKPYMQFIFATHNANIPVLGDSERVLVVEFQGTKIDVAQGNIDLDSTHKQIVDIMEGGKEAFNKRQLIYIRGDIMHYIEVKNVSQIYSVGNEPVNALTNISFSIEKG